MDPGGSDQGRSAADTAVNSVANFTKTLNAPGGTEL